MTPKAIEQTKDLKTPEDYNNHKTAGAREQSLPSNNIKKGGEQSLPLDNTLLLEKLMIFIDGGNLFQCAKSENVKIDFEKLVDFLSGRFNLIRVYYVKVHYENSTLQCGVSTLSIQKPTNKPHLLRCGKTQRLFDYTGVPINRMWNKNKESKDSFEKRLNKQKIFLDNLAFDLNFHVITKPLVLEDNKIKEKGIDVNIATDILWHGLSNNYDTFVLLSGDKDLMDCLTRMKDNGKKVIVANFEGKISREVKRIADKYINLSDHLEEIQR